MAIDFIALHDEITKDPKSLGYGDLVKQGSDAGIADIINGLSIATLSKGMVTREVFLSDFGPQVLSILSDSGLETSFGPLLKLLALASTVDYGNTIVLGALHNMIGIAGLTQDSIESTISRPCSRAEELWGDGTTITSNDVSFALRGDI